MATSSTRWHPVQPSQFPHEQEALEFLRSHLPDSAPFRAWSNFEFIADDGSVNEVDALVASTECVYLIEIKHWSGVISGSQNSWVIAPPGGRERFEENPLLLCNRKAKKLKSLLGKQAAFKHGKVPYIQAAVFLSSPQCTLRLDPISSLHIYQRNGRQSIVDLIQGRISQGPGFSPLGREVEQALSRAMTSLGLGKRARAATVGDYRLLGLLAENDVYQDWEVRHLRVDSDRRRVRIFPYARKAADAEKRERKDLATREYALLREVRHDHILAPVQLTESEIGPALVYDYFPHAQRLHHRIGAGAARLDISKRLDLMRQIAEAVAFAHQRGVYHRALSPWTIEISESLDPATRLQARIRDWQSGCSASSPQSSTRMTLHLGQSAGVIDSQQAAVYAPPEVISGHGYDPASIDLFGLGALCYAIFSGQHPADDAEQMLEKCRQGNGLLISEALDGAPDSLQLLVQSATDPHPVNRPSDVREFLRLLDEVEDDLTTPDPQLGVQPADAMRGDVLTGGFKVLKRLGAGSTCHALAVEREGQSGVLKVAKDASHNQRLQIEAQTLKALHHPNIVRFFGIYEIDGLTAIFLEQAGERTIGQRLRDEGVLSLDLLERFGDELLSTLVYLEREGVNHRDIKPENIGIGATGKGALTLKLFDFSLSRAPLDQIRAGTPPYLDPFLCQRRPPRWDLHAERFAAGMTLHELATGTLPSWGTGGEDPASNSEEANLDTERFDASVRDALAAFFAKVLARDPRQRFDNADEMHLAWKRVFKHIDQSTLDEDEISSELDLTRVEDLSEATSLSLLGLTPRELNAADRLGATTVGQLLALPGIRFYRNRGIGQQITRRLRQLRDQLAAHMGRAAAIEAPDESGASMDRLVRNLESIKLEPGAASMVSAWLGRATGGKPTPLLELPTIREVAEISGSTRNQVQEVVDKAVEKWSKAGWMSTLRDEIADFLVRREGIVVLEELAGKLLGTHGSTVVGDERIRQACAVIQAALETEAVRDSARFVLFRGHTVPLVLATEALGKNFAAPPAERGEFAKALAREAQTLAFADPLTSPRRVEEVLTSIRSPAGDQSMSAERRLRLAAAANPGIALSSRLELYPKGMSAERALRLGANTLLGARRLSVAQLHTRIHSRFSHAQALPGRPALDELLAAIEFPLKWFDAGDGLPEGYAMPQRQTGLTGSSTARRLSTAAHVADPGSPEAQAAIRFTQAVERALTQRRVLLVSCGLARIETAATKLAVQFALTPLSMDRLLIDTLQAQALKLGAQWPVVRQADRCTPGTLDWRRLQSLVERAMPMLRQRLIDDARPLLLQHLGLLVRYGQTALIQQLRDHALDSAMPARLLLVPGDPTHAPVLDGCVLPVITPADWTHLPASWPLDAANPRVETADLLAQAGAVQR